MTYYLLSAIYKSVVTLSFDFMKMQCYNRIQIYCTRWSLCNDFYRPSYVFKQFVSKGIKPLLSTWLNLTVFFFFLKSGVYNKKSMTTHALKERIVNCRNEIHSHLHKTIMENSNKRVRM